MLLPVLTRFVLFENDNQSPWVTKMDNVEELKDCKNHAKGGEGS